MSAVPFCTARVGELIDTSDGKDVQFVQTELSTAASVIQFLQTTYDRFATQLADENAERSESERIDTTKIGGFGVQLTNRFGGQVEVCLGRQYCLLIRLSPPPCQIYRGSVPHDGTLVFYLDGWHHTEMELSSLVPRDECLKCLYQWLETDDFPQSQR